MKFIFGIIGFLLLVVVVMVMIALVYVRRGFIKIKKVVTGDLDDEETFKRMADKHYRPKPGNPTFDKDYFKRASGGSDKQQTPPSGEQQTRRTTTTSEGVTIIDDRVEDNRKKIFDDSEGEYVEYQEVE